MLAGFESFEVSANPLPAALISRFKNAAYYLGGLAYFGNWVVHSADFRFRSSYVTKVRHLYLLRIRQLYQATFLTINRNLSTTYVTLPKGT
jgi:hypothetical protein